MKRASINEESAMAIQDMIDRQIANERQEKSGDELLERVMAAIEQQAMPVARPWPVYVKVSAITAGLAASLILGVGLGNALSSLAAPTQLIQVNDAQMEFMDVLMNDEQ